MKLRYPEMKDPFDHDGYKRGQERELAEGTKERQERYERKLLREIEEEDKRQARSGLVDPPPELSPSELKERELAERLDRVESKSEQAALDRQFTLDPSRFRGSMESREQHERKEGLRLLRIQKDAEAQAERNRQHEKHRAKQIKTLEDRIAEVQSKREAERQRHRRMLAELDAAFSEANDKLGALLRPLPPNETTEDRLKAVLA